MSLEIVLDVTDAKTQSRICRNVETHFESHHCDLWHLEMRYGVRKRLGAHLRSACTTNSPTAHH
jgi:hypothetical protein